MRNHRFKGYLLKLLRDVPDVTNVELIPHQEVQVIRVTLADGGEALTVDLLVTSTPPTGGDSHDRPETIVTKPGREPRPAAS